MKRILIFSTDDHLMPTGGAEQAFGHITRRLPEYEFDLICAKLRKDAKLYEKVGNVHIHRIGFGIPKFDGILLALFGHRVAYRLMKEHTYDLVWSIMASYGAFSAVRVKKAKKIPFLLTLQEGDSFEYIYKKVRFVRRSFDRIFSSADAIQAISYYLLAWGRQMGFKGHDGIVIPNGVDIDAFTHRYTDEEKRFTRSGFGFPADATILITSSRLEKKNGIGDVIDALALLPERICFVICGSGSLEKEIKEKIASYSLEPRVKFLGFVDPNDLPLLMQSSDVFIRPSLTEGLGNAFLEAMASRVLTVGTDAGGIPDFLTHGKTGFVVKKEDPSSIAQVITYIEGLPGDEKEAVRDNAYDLIHSSYSWDKIAIAMNGLFEKLTLNTK